MLRHRVSKGPVRTFKVKWKYVIHTIKGWKVQMRENRLPIGWDRCDWNGI